MRERIRSGLTQSIKARDSRRSSTLRLITAAIKDRDIAARTAGKDKVSDEDILGILAKMVKQREESAQIYQDNDRPELAVQEREEIVVIKEYLPQQLSGEEVGTAIAEAIESSGAEGLRDMGKVMAILKGQHTGRMDFGQASRAVKEALSDSDT